VFRADTGKWDDYPEPQAIPAEGYIAAENMYIEEMRCFVRAVRGEAEYPYSLAEDQNILGLLYAAERSSGEPVDIRAA
jgi:hypothetical protein